VLLVESLDRLSRQQIMSALGRLAEIVNAGIDVVTLADGQR
jgi:DNA invertase Pin-like site-specific DNA recombinase